MISLSNQVEVIREEKAAAATTDRTYVQQHDVRPPALLPDTSEQGVDEKPKTEKPDRHTCPTCGNDWPASYGTKCYNCRWPSTGRLQREYGDRYEANHHAGLAAPEPGKYDCLFAGDEPKPDPPPMAPDPAP